MSRANTAWLSEQSSAEGLRANFEAMAALYTKLAADADAGGLVKHFRAHAAVADGYYRAARILGGVRPVAARAQQNAALQKVTHRRRRTEPKRG